MNDRDFQIVIVEAWVVLVGCQNEVLNGTANLNTTKASADNDEMPDFSKRIFSP